METTRRGSVAAREDAQHCAASRRRAQGTSATHHIGRHHQPFAPVGKHGELALQLRACHLRVVRVFGRDTRFVRQRTQNGSLGLPPTCARADQPPIPMAEAGGVVIKADAFVSRLGRLVEQVVVSATSLRIARGGG